MRCSSPPDLADVQRAVPLGDRREVRRDEALDVVLGALRQLGRVLDDEAGPAVQRAPDPERDGEGVAPLDRPVARAEQPEPRPRAGGEHQVARQRGAAPGQQPRAVALGHAGLQAGEHTAHAVRGLARGPLEGGELVDLVDHPQPRRPGRSGGRSRSPPSPHAPDGAPELVDEEGRRLDRVPRRRTSSSRRRRPGCRRGCPRRAGSTRSGADASRGWPGRLRSWNITDPHRQRGGGSHALRTRCPRARPGRPTPRRRARASSKRGSKPVR